MKRSTSANRQALLAVVTSSLVAAFSACNSDTTPSPPANPNQSQSLYNKYGGAPGVQKIVTDIGAALIADCTQNPFFTTTINFDNVQTDGDGHGANGFDTQDRLASCLVSQFTAAFGGPSTYSGTATVTGVPSLTIAGQTYDCQNMTVVHSSLGISPAVFDQFIADAGMVLQQDGVSQVDINAVASALMGFKPEIVAPADEQQNYDYQPGQPMITGSPTLACTHIPSTSSDF